jgi:hypothetical protein
MAARIRQVHAFFRQYSHAKMLPIAFFHRYLQNFKETALETRWCLPSPASALCQTRHAF